MKHLPTAYVYILGSLKKIIIVTITVVSSITGCFNFFMMQKISSQTSQISKH